MKIAAATLATGLLIAATPALPQGASDHSPGHKMLQKGPKAGYPGASGYAPGHNRMLGKGPRTGYPGASGYAPGHSTTGSAIVKHDRDVKVKVKTK